MNSEKIICEFKADHALGECDMDILEHYALVITTIGWNNELMRRTYGHDSNGDYSQQLKMTYADWINSLSEDDHETLLSLVDGNLKM